MFSSHEPLELLSLTEASKEESIPKLSARIQGGAQTIVEAPPQMEEEEFGTQSSAKKPPRETLQEVTNNHNHHSNSEYHQLIRKSPKRLISIDDTASVKFVQVSSRTSLKPGEPGSSTNQEEDLHTYFNNSEKSSENLIKVFRRPGERFNSSDIPKFIPSFL